MQIIHRFPASNQFFFTVTLLFCTLMIRTVPLSAQTGISDGRMGLAIYHFDSAEFDEAVSVLREMLSDDVHDLAVYELLAASLIHLNRFDEAETLLFRGFQYHDDHPNLRLLHIQTVQMSQPERARQLLLELESDVRDDPGSYPYTLQDIRRYRGQLFAATGTRHLESGNFSESADAFRQSRRLMPDSVSVHRQLVYALFRAEDFTGALLEAGRSLKQFPGDPVLRRLSVQLLIQLGDREQALRQLGELMRDEDDNLELAVAYGQMLIEGGQVAEGRTHFESLLGRYPENRSLYDALMELNRRHLNLDGQIEILDRMLRHFPGDKDATLELAGIYILKGNPDAAVSLYDSLITAGAEPLPLLRRKAAVLLRSGRQDEAYASLLPWADEPGIQFELAWTALETGNIDTAAEHITTYLDLASGDADGWELLARIHRARGDSTAAFKAWDTAYKNGSLSPFAFRAHIRLQHSFPDPGPVIPETEPGSDFIVRETGKIVSRLSQWRTQMAMESQSVLSGMLPSAYMKPYPVSDQIRDWESGLEELADELTNRFGLEKTSAILETIAKNHPGYTFFQMLAGRTLEQAGYSGRAVTVYLNAVSSEARLPGPHHALASLYEREGDHQQALLWYERALGVSAEPEIYEALIRLHREAGTLGSLCDRWLLQYRSGRAPATLRNFLIEALHKAGRLDEASAISRNQ